MINFRVLKSKHQLENLSLNQWQIQLAKTFFPEERLTDEFIEQLKEIYCRFVRSWRSWCYTWSNGFRRNRA